MKKTFLSIVIILTVVGCNATRQNSNQPNQSSWNEDSVNSFSSFEIDSSISDSSSTVPSGDKEPHIVLNNVSTFNIHSDLQQSFLNDENIDNIHNYASGVEELSYPRSLDLSFSKINIKENTFYVDLSKDKDFSSFKRYETNSNSVSLTNLEIGTTYYWKVSTDSVSSDVSSFTTLDNGIRNIYVDGMTNVRDIGGYTVNNNHRIKQGLIYRSARLNVSWQNEKEYQVSEKGIKTLKEDLSIRSEIDLRRAGDGETSYIQNSVLGTDINYFDCRCDYGSDHFLIAQKSGIKSMFLALTDLSNLPAIFHCDIGTDRTGACAFLLGALLGKSEKDLYIDYLFSNFGNIGSSRSLDSLNEKITDLYSYEGNSLQEKTINYLVDIGIKRNKIIELINYCLEPIIL